MSGPILVPIQSAPDTSVPTGTQISAKFTLIGPDGTRCVFNDQTDRDYVGVLTDVTGLDSPDVRESADDLVQMDGGIHGDFFYGRRPVTLSGVFLNPTSADDRNRRQTKLQRASNAMRGDAVLFWMLDGGVEQQITVRRQQPLRITGQWQKQFQLQVIAADPRIYSTTLSNSTTTTNTGATYTGRSYPKTYPFSYPYSPPVGQLIVNNAGTTPTFPIITIQGPGANPVIANYTTGEDLRLTLTLAVNDVLTIDTLNRTVILNNTQSRYSAVNFATSEWFGLQPGNNTLQLSFDAFISGSVFSCSWRDAWL